MNTQEYFQQIENNVKNIYDLVSVARKQNIDPESHPEVIIAKNMAERVVGLISVVAPQLKDTTLIDRIMELEKQYGSQDWRIALTVSLEVAQNKFFTFEDKREAMEVGIRVGIAYITNGVVSSPLEGFTKLGIKQRRDGKEYLALYFSGPMRSAGGTAESVSVLIGDYVRKKMGYHAYDAEEKEVKRTATELVDYNDRITNLQYMPTEDEIVFLIERIGVQIDGEPSEKLEASNFKGLDRVETDRLRNGVCLVVGEGLCQKAPKLYAKLQQWGKDFDLDEWTQMLEAFLTLQKKIKAKQGNKKPDEEKKVKPDHTFIKDIVAGRPVFTHPMRPGGFRLRYGRARSSGLSAQSIHPATMAVLRDFIAIGTQLKVERPGKSTVVSSCEQLDGPIVRLENGNVLALQDPQEVKKIVNEIEEILYLGDILISYGDFFDRGHTLAPVGYCEEWWALELASKKDHFKGTDDALPLQEYIDNPWTSISFDDAKQYSEKYGVPLHPKHTFFWDQISMEDFTRFNAWYATAVHEDKKIIIPHQEDQPKEVLEILGIPHTVVSNEYVVITGDIAKALHYCMQQPDLKKQTALEALNIPITIRKKGGTFIGARMGRPEKAKLRKLKGSPQVLFPVGDEGGRLRSFQSSLEAGNIKNSFPVYTCEPCKKETIYPLCETCNTPTKRKYLCPICGPSEKICHEGAQRYKEWELDIRHYFNDAVKKSGLQLSQVPELIKGVRGTSNRDHIPEHLTKGILRASNNLFVNKDGTIRFDMTEMPLTHFKPKEIGTSVEQLKTLGYTQDMHGKVLEDENQVVEMFVQDIIMPAATESLDETSDKIFIRTAQFIDDLLVNLYKQKPFYNVKTREDLVGHLFVGLAPHISAGTVARIIGFSQTQTILAHPYFHCSVRRDCDGDELCVMFLVDTLLNFSRHYLPSHRGSTQDAPLVLTSTLTATEVDDMIFNMDVASSYPLALYTAAEEFKKPWDVSIEQLNKRLGTGKEYTNFGYTHETDDINTGVRCSAYKFLPSMDEKVAGQMELAEKIRAVDKDAVARLVIERHFIRDLLGNLRKFSSQMFRCSKCNEKFRRPPLGGNCTKCHGNIIFTISEGSIIKYLEPSLALAEKYVDSPYLKTTLELTKLRVESIFGKMPDKQEGLSKFF